MLILDKRRAIERIMALSEGNGRAALAEAAPPKGARARIAAYEPKPAPQGTLADAPTPMPLRRRVRRGRAPSPV
jgi:hypothetical protein